MPALSTINTDYGITFDFAQNPKLVYEVIAKYSLADASFNAWTSARTRFNFDVFKITTSTASLIEVEMTTGSTNIQIVDVSQFFSTNLDSRTETRFESFKKNKLTYQLVGCDRSYGSDSDPSIASNTGSIGAVSPSLTLTGETTSSSYQHACC